MPKARETCEAWYVCMYFRDVSVNPDILCLVVSGGSSVIGEKVSVNVQTVAEED